MLNLFLLAKWFIFSSSSMTFLLLLLQLCVYLLIIDIFCTQFNVVGPYRKSGTIFLSQAGFILPVELTAIL